VTDNSNASVSNNHIEKTNGADFFEVHLSPVLRPVTKQTSNERVLLRENKQKVKVQWQLEKR